MASIFRVGWAERYTATMDHNICKGRRHMVGISHKAPIRVRRTHTRGAPEHTLQGGRQRKRLQSANGTELGNGEGRWKDPWMLALHTCAHAHTDTQAWARCARAKPCACP